MPTNFWFIQSALATHVSIIYGRFIMWILYESREKVIHSMGLYSLFAVAIIFHLITITLNRSGIHVTLFVPLSQLFTFFCLSILSCRAAYRLFCNVFNCDLGQFSSVSAREFSGEITITDICGSCENEVQHKEIWQCTVLHLTSVRL